MLFRSSKLDVHSRLEAASLAVRHNLVEAHEATPAARPATALRAVS